MIKVYTNRVNYQYDLNAIIKAFYPEHDVKVIDIAQIGIGQNEHENIVRVEIQDFKIDVYVRIDDCERCYVNQFDENMTSVSKNQHKLALYRNLCDYTGRTLPWGNLTGVRPTKLAMGILAEGLEDGSAVERLKEEHAVSDEKAWLSVEIAEREKQILDTVNCRDGYSLYIGIPFCPTTCLYCSFTSYTISAWKEKVGEYLNALFKEIDFAAEACRGKTLDTVYIGGGTPTTLGADELEKLLKKLTSSFDFRNVKEFSVEAGRADSITCDKLEVLKRYGATRISINPQTMKEETLKLIGRCHTAAQVRDAFAMARRWGFDNINMDIILGLPGELEADVAYTIREIEMLNPDSLTVHSLAVKRASRLSQWIEENGINTLVNTDATMRIAREGALRLGMKPYYLYRQKNMSGNFENVGYAREGKYGIYNILIMEEKQTILALGAGSISKRVYADGNIARCENVKEVAQYIGRIDEMIERKRALFSD